VKKSSSGKIPLFLTVDVEPDQYLDSTALGTVTWAGVPRMIRQLDVLRQRLGELADSPVRVGWFLRMDPQIQVFCGRPDAVAELFGEEFHRRVVGSGDYLGLHVHASRWDSAAGWVNDWYDTERCISHVESGLAAFEVSIGAPAARYKFTADVLPSDAMFTTLRQAGVEVCLRPSLAPQRLPYFGRVARQPYLASPSRSEGPWVVPWNATTFRVRYGDSPLKAAARHARRGPFRRCPLDAYISHLGPDEFWDAMAVSLRSMPRPYVSLELRTQAIGSPFDLRQQAVLEALVNHPLAGVVEGADPLAFVKG
jgi:hypothetical protein